MKVKNKPRSMFTIILLVISIILISAVLLFLYIFNRGKFNPITIPAPIPAEGINIPVLASFTGPKNMGILAFGHNSLNPLLRLYEDSMEYRFFFKNKKQFREIEKIDTFNTFGTANINFYFKDQGLEFTTNLYNEANQKEVLRFFHKKEVPLTDRALDLIK